MVSRVEALFERITVGVFREAGSGSGRHTIYRVRRHLFFQQKDSMASGKALLFYAWKRVRKGLKIIYT